MKRDDPRWRRGVEPTRKRFRLAYLHVGLGKTGSSTIQRQLLRHAEEIEARFGLHFPRGFADARPFGGNHTLVLASLFKEVPQRIRANIVAGYDTPERVAELNEKTRRELQAGFDSSAAHSLLLSAEGASDFNAATIGRLLQWLKSLAEEVKIIACLRHPLDALASNLQQKLKTDGVLENLYRNPPAYSFIKLFTALEQHVRREDIVLYDYADAVRSPAGLTAEFMAQLGFDAGDLFDRDEVVNPRMSHRAALLLSALNRQRPRLINKVPNPERRGDELQRFLAIPGPGFQPPASVYDTLRVKIEPELQWLKEHYGIELEHPAPPPTPPEEELSQAEIDQLALQIADTTG